MDSIRSTLSEQLPSEASSSYTDRNLSLINTTSNVNHSINNSDVNPLISTLPPTLPYNNNENTNSEDTTVPNNCVNTKGLADTSPPPRGEDSDTVPLLPE